MTAAQSPRTAIVVGAGFGGIAAAIALQREGVDVTVLERGARVGGVWHHNTYPGAACDVPSHLYSYSWAPNPRWGRRFAPGAEIQRYVEDVAREAGVLERVRCSTDATAARWDADGARWEVEAGGETLRADLLVAACGQLHRPAIPPIADLDRFAGRALHSSRWPDDLDVRGKRVGVMGSGASALQLVPAIVDETAHLTVLQRTPAWILPKPDGAYSERARRAFIRVPALQRAGRLGFWTLLEAGIGGFIGHPWVLAPFAAVGRAHLRRQVRDPALRARLTPDFAIGCKRILLSNRWYPTLQRPDVSLVSERVARAVPDGVVLEDGRHVPLDVLVFATGFHAREFVAPMEVTGRDGVTLEAAWDGLPNAWHGLSVPGFPNLMLMYGPNTFGGSGSAIYVLESQARHVAAAARALRERGAATLEVRADAHAAFLRELRAKQATTIWATGGCSSWYLDDQGRDPTNWPGTTIGYRRRTARVDPDVYAMA